MRVDHLPIADFSRHEEGRAWLARLPEIVARLTDEWGLTLGEPFLGGSAAYVAPAGDNAVFKVTWPHREAAGEGPGLRWWDGRGSIRLLHESAEDYALLVERCVPGEILTNAPLPAEERLRIGADLMRQLWSCGAPVDSEIELLADVTAEWADLVEERMARIAPPYDPGIVARGVQLLRTLPTTATRRVVVHGDFNPGNILSTKREPWLAIDTKPMIGDPGYDPCPLIGQIDDPHLYDNPLPVIRARYQLVADVCGEPAERLLAWAFARTVESALWYANDSEIDDGADAIGGARRFAQLLD